MNQEKIATQIINKAFKNKVDKGGNPYVDHLNRIAENCPPLHINDELRLVALLHDLLEDCPEWNEDSLRCFFYEEIVVSVVAITKKKNQKYDEYIQQVKKDRFATIVKILDLEDNMNITRLDEITDKDLDRLKKYHKAYKELLKND